MSVDAALLELDALLAHEEIVTDTRMFLDTTGDTEIPTEAAAHVLP